ncbi:hypothetical protein FOL47_007410 [Perkinsus chesapeaki]|uniref:Uncharacterized protein n=1 Tax=Perkinsus chesapeaki TaxID=330153 RepID=A0A7J6LKW6_PERCH|nr:hypothetical protein FOL47_007410 [Perkinsus chesapeaki]
MLLTSHTSALEHLLASTLWTDSDEKCAAQNALSATIMEYIGKPMCSLDCPKETIWLPQPPDLMFVRKRALYTVKNRLFALDKSLSVYDLGTDLSWCLQLTGMAGGKILTVNALVVEDELFLAKNTSQKLELFYVKLEANTPCLVAKRIWYYVKETRELRDSPYPRLCKRNGDNKCILLDYIQGDSTL